MPRHVVHLLAAVPAVVLASLSPEALGTTTRVFTRKAHRSISSRKAHEVNGLKDVVVDNWWDGDTSMVLASAEVTAGYTHVGCYKSMFDSRSLEEALFEAADMSVEKCFGHCSEAGAPLMGLLYGSWCFCGWKAEEKYMRYGEGTCGMKCVGNDEEMCGGYFEHDLYRINEESAVTSDDNEKEALSLEMDDLLALHNEARCIHGAAPLKSNANTTDIAQRHLEELTSNDTCGLLYYSEDYINGSIGETLFMCYTGNETYDCYTPAFAMEYMYEKETTERIVSEGGEETITQLNVRDYGEDAMQLLWKSSSVVGCAVDSCVRGGWHVNVLVCNYDSVAILEDSDLIEVEVGPPSVDPQECLDDFPEPSQPTSSPVEPEPEPMPEPVAPTPTPVRPTPSPVKPTPSPVEPEPEPTPEPVAPTPTPVRPTPSPVKPTPSPVEPEPEPTTEPVAPTPTPVRPAQSPMKLTPSPVEAEPEPTPEPVAPATGACGPNPCENGGTCSEDPDGGYVCTCPADFAGMKCQHNTAAMAKFNINVEFIGTWTESRKDVFLSAANRWAEVITHVPCGGSPDDPAGRLLITAQLSEIDGSGGVLGSAGPNGIWNDCQTISYRGMMDFDISDITDMENQGTLEGVIMHEMGHVIGVGTLWGDCSSCRETFSSQWNCPAAVQVYNDLSGNTGSSAGIVETDGQDGTRCGHFDEDDFGDELMTGWVSNGLMPLSKLTAASLEDIGYVVAAEKCDGYALIANRLPSVLSPDAIVPFELTDSVEDIHMDVQDSDGNIVEMKPGVRFRF